MPFRPNSSDTWGNLPEDIKQTLKKQLIQRDSKECTKKYGFGCGQRKKALTMDHIIPISQNGPVCDLGNLQLLCFRCHSKKTALENKINVRRMMSSAARIAALNLPDEHGILWQLPKSQVL